jgi:hypothetical protein
LLDWFPLISLTAPRGNPPPSSSSTAAIPQGQGRRIWHSRKLTRTSKAALELWGEVGGSHIRLGLYLGKFGARLQSYR